MAGNIKSSKSPKTPVRKQWKIPDTSLYKLRYQLAEDGCMESQFEIAKQLLQDECDIRAIREANYRQAIHWLLRSAEQGSEEALVLLEKCHREGFGITEDNINEIKTCLSMTQYEKLARKTAREIYSSLCKECDHIRLCELNKHMLNIHVSRNGNKIEYEQNIHKCIEYESVKDTLLKESNLLSAAISFANGLVPSISQSLLPNTCICTSQTKYTILSHISMNVINKAILFFANTSLAILSNIYFHLFIILYLFLYLSHFSFIIPLAVYYLSFIVMILYSFRIFEFHKTFQHYSIWADLFHYHSDGSLDSEKAKYDFLNKNTNKQAVFFLAFFFHLALHPFIYKYWIPHSEFGILSLYLSAVCLIAYGTCNSQNNVTRFLIICSYFLIAFARYPYSKSSLMNKSWTNFKLNLGNSTSIFGSKLDFNLNCKAFLYAMVPGILVALAKMKNWRGVHFYFLPHCITLSWFQLFMLNVEFITWNGLFRIVIIFVLFIYFWPLCQVAAIVLPVIAFDSWCNIQDINLRIVLFMATASIFALIIKFSTLKAIPHKNIFTLKVILLIISIIFLSYKHGNLSTHVYEKEVHVKKYDTESVLTWEEYQYVCLDTNRRKANHIIKQIDCLHLNGLHVAWDGYIINIRLSQIQNMWSELLNSFPKFIRENIKCFLGQKTMLTCTDEHCKTINKKVMLDNRCDINKWNKYEHEITVNLQSGILTAGPKILLKANHDFTNFTQMLQTNDKINFKGVLQINPLTNSPNEALVIHLEEISCLSCYNVMDEVISRKSINLSKNYVKCFIISIRNILNFILNPIIVFQ